MSVLIQLSELLLLESIS